MVIAVASVAMVLDLDRRTVGIGLGSVGPVALDAPEASAWLADRLQWEPDRVAVRDPSDVSRRSGRWSQAAARPIDDHRGRAAYRRHAVGVLARRALRRWCRERVLRAAGQRRSTATSTTRGWARACSTCCANGWACPAPRPDANRASADRARCSVDGVLVCACLVLGAAAAGAEVVTPEGLQPDERGALTAVQRAFVDEGAVQCGFCTPGSGHGGPRPARPRRRIPTTSRCGRRSRETSAGAPATAGCSPPIRRAAVVVGTRPARSRRHGRRPGVTTTTPRPRPSRSRRTSRRSAPRPDGVPKVRGEFAFAGDLWAERHVVGPDPALAASVGTRYAGSTCPPRCAIPGVQAVLDRRRPGGPEPLRPRAPRPGRVRRRHRPVRGRAGRRRRRRPSRHRRAGPARPSSSTTRCSSR